ncbi:MAG: hypothetical protein ACYCQJ_01505 [Nitrososphaerales archaeon]
MDSAKLKKLQEYSLVLKSQASSKEAQGNVSEALKDYVKLVDILLLLANESKDHPTWQKLIAEAESYQKKARTLANPDAKEERRKDPPYEIKTMDKNAGQASILKSLKLPLMGKKQEPNPVEPVLQPVGAQSIISSWAKDLNTPKQVPKVETQDSVPFSLYSQVLEEKAILGQELENFRSKEKEYLAIIEAKNNELAERPTKEEFLANYVLKSEYERLKESTQDVITKEKYAMLQEEVKELQLKVKNYIPPTILDEMFEYVSFLVSTLPKVDPQRSEASS